MVVNVGTDLTLRRPSRKGKEEFADRKRERCRADLLIVDYRCLLWAMQRTLNFNSVVVLLKVELLGSFAQWM